MKLWIFSLLAATTLSAVEMPRYTMTDRQKIAVQNSILAKVNDKTISMMDVKKKMDVFFHQHYAHLADNQQARLQFYETSWRAVLMEMIDQELIIADATDKEVKLTDGEVREQMEERFGPNVMKTLDQIGLTYAEATKLIRNEMLVQRMNWWFVQSKALQTVTPQDIRQAYRFYLKDHPSFTEWKYQVVSIRADKEEGEKVAAQVYELLSKNGGKPDWLADELKAFEKAGVTIQISHEYSATDPELSELHKASLSTLAQGTYSKPSFQMSRADKKAVYRCFYLCEKVDHPAPAFDDLSAQLKNSLMQKAIARETQTYLEKLRKHYGYDTASLKESVPEDLHPFSLQ